MKSKEKDKDERNSAVNTKWAVVEDFYFTSKGSEEEAFYYCRCFTQSWNERKSEGKDVLLFN
jgi:hypothetical protein